MAQRGVARWRMQLSDVPGPDAAFSAAVVGDPPEISLPSECLTACLTLRRRRRVATPPLFQPYTPELEAGGPRVPRNPGVDLHFSVSRRSNRVDEKGGGSHRGGNVVAAIADLAHRLGVDADAIVVISQEEVTWRDGSMGCPQPGMRYTQALINGYRIVLAHAGREYHYHGGRTRGPFLCEPP
jgi:hypothetical protein